MRLASKLTNVICHLDFARQITYPVQSRVLSLGRCLKIFDKLSRTYQFGPLAFCRRYIHIYYIYLCKKKIRYTVKRALPVSQVTKGGCFKIKQSHQSQPIPLDATCVLKTLLTRIVMLISKFCQPG